MFGPKAVGILECFVQRFDTPYRQRTLKVLLISQTRDGVSSGDSDKHKRFRTELMPWTRSASNWEKYGDGNEVDYLKLDRTVLKKK